MATLARFRWIAAATVLGSLLGFLVSYLFNPRYSASAVLDVEDSSWQQCRGCGLPDKSVSQQKLANYLQQVFSLNNLRPLIERERIARPEDLEKVYWETHKKMKLQVGGDAASPDLDLVYTDSTPQRAEEFCGLLTSAIRKGQGLTRRRHSMPASSREIHVGQFLLLASPLSITLRWFCHALTGPSIYPTYLSVQHSDRQLVC